MKRYFLIFFVYLDFRILEVKSLFFMSGIESFFYGKFDYIKSKDLKYCFWVFVRKLRY